MTDFEQIADLLTRHREAGPLGCLSLEKDSIAVVAGAYEGATIAFLRKLYDCYVVGFEPQAWAVEKLLARFSGDEKVDIHAYGLGIESGTFSMYEHGTDAASFVPYDNNRTVGTGTLYDAESVLVGKLASVDAAVFNMESYEYQLIPYLADCGLLPSELVLQHHKVPAKGHEFDPNDAANVANTELFSVLYKHRDLKWAGGIWTWWGPYR